MRYQTVGFTYKSCEQALREKLAFETEEAMRGYLENLKAFDFVREAFVVATCNRIETVLLTKDSDASYHSVLGLMAQRSGVNFYEIKRSARRYDDQEAIRRFFEVVSSLDSLVVGESQITGQVKDAFRFAFENGFAKERLGELLSFALKCAAEVRSVTRISQKPVSIASVAVALAREELGEAIRGTGALVVGTGEMGVLAAKHLLRAGCDVVLMGRNKEKAAAVAAALGENVKPAAMEKLPEYVDRYRLLFSATRSRTPVLTESMIGDETFERWWFDLAVPHDIEEISLPAIHLFRVDDLRSVSERNHALRQEQALKASETVGAYVKAFIEHLRTLSVEPFIKQMYLEAQEAIETELARAIKKGFVPAEHEANMRKMAEVMFRRFLHRPVSRLRKVSKIGERTECVDTLKTLFDFAQNKHKGERS